MEPSRPLTPESMPHPSRPPYQIYTRKTEEPQRATLPRIQGLPFASLVFTTLTLVPAMAHLFEMPNKMQLSAADYLVVQQLYQGWAVMGAFTIAALLSVLGWAIVARRVDDQETFTWVVSALGCLVASQIVYWSFTFPSNMATENWTTLPDNWTVLRNQWEYSHAVNAGFISLAILCLLSAVLTNRSLSRSRFSS
jgi:hypothetical protein